MLLNTSFLPNWNLVLTPKFVNTFYDVCKSLLIMRSAATLFWVRVFTEEN